MPAESLSSTNCLSCPLSSYQKASHQDNKISTYPKWKSMFLQPSKSPQVTISIAREIQRQEKEKGSLESLQTDRPPPPHKLGLSFCHLGTVRALLPCQPMSKLFSSWFLFFRPAVKQKWYLCLSHQSLPSREHTPAKQGQKSQEREAGFDWLLPTVLKTENWREAHIGSFFKK